MERIKIDFQFPGEDDNRRNKEGIRRSPCFTITSPSGKDVIARFGILSTLELEIPIVDPKDREAALQNQKTLSVAPNDSPLTIYEALGVSSPILGSDLKNGDINYSSMRVGVLPLGTYYLQVRISGKDFQNYSQLLKAIAPHGWNIKPESN